MKVIVYDASALAELSTTAGEDVWSALFSDGVTTGDAAAAAAAIGSVVSVAVNTDIHIQHLPCSPTQKPTHYFYGLFKFTRYNTDTRLPNSIMTKMHFLLEFTTYIQYNNNLG